MELIVAVYDDWGIGCEGTQPVALSVDRKFFRETTRGCLVIAGRKTVAITRQPRVVSRGCLVIAGRKTVADFPGGKPLPGRTNVVLTRNNIDLPGFTVCHSPEEAAALAKTADRAMVIGGGSVYSQMLPMCDTAYVTKVHCTIPCDTYFPDLDADPQWELTQILMSGEENGIAYEMCLYRRK